MTLNRPSHPPVNPWLIALTVSLATFMEVMDTSIANVSLRYIAGSMAASQDESTWVLTSYLVSNAIILPISGWLSSVLGRKRFYMGCVALFTISSFLCGIAPTLGSLLFFRVLQGMGGGGLAPSEQAILTDTFPAAQRGMAFAIYGVAVVVAPAVGPALGGWITDTYSWRWIFFINIPVGALSLFLTGLLVKDSEGAKQEQKAVWKKGLKIDYVGFGLMAVGLGCLQVVLDKGQEDDWFGSTFITLFAIAAAVGIVGGVLWELFVAEEPIVDLSLYKSRGFLFTNAMMFGLMFVLLATTQLLPQFVQEITGYDATKAGLVLMAGGFVIMAMMPVAGFLVKKVQPKYLIMVGLVSIALAMFHMTGFTTYVSFKVVSLARVYQAIGLAFLWVPINTLAFSALPKGKSNNASALINLMRNLGGSVGISVATTLLVRRSQVHQGYLVRNLTSTALSYNARLAAMAHTFVTRGFDQVDAMKKATAAFFMQVQRQAVMLSYIDVFQMLILATLVTLVMSIFLKKIDLSKASAAA